MRRAALLGEYEPELQEFAALVIRSGDLVIDVGANVGLHALNFAALAGAGGRVLAFEPAPRPRDLLEAGVARNGFRDRVRVLPVVAGAAAGRTQLWIDQGIGLTNSTLQNWSCSQDVIEVGVATVDEVVSVEHRRPLALLKVDAEGAEAAVLRGARRLLEERQPRAIAVEVSSFDASTDLIGDLERQGYVRVRPVRGVLIADTRPLPSNSGCRVGDPAFDFRNVYLLRDRDVGKLESS